MAPVNASSLGQARPNARRAEPALLAVSVTRWPSSLLWISMRGRSMLKLIVVRSGSVSHAAFVQHLSFGPGHSSAIWWIVSARGRKVANVDSEVRITVTSYSVHFRGCEI